MSICSGSMEFCLLFKHLSSWVPLKLKAWPEMQYLVLRFAQVTEDIHAFWNTAQQVASRKHTLIKPLSTCALVAILTVLFMVNAIQVLHSFSVYIFLNEYYSWTVPNQWQCSKLSWGWAKTTRRCSVQNIHTLIRMYICISGTVLCRHTIKFPSAPSCSW